jgi:hypothetical protein
MRPEPATRWNPKTCERLRFRATCESARGPDADRHVKLLIQFAVEGSLSGAYPQADSLILVRKRWEPPNIQEGLPLIRPPREALAGSEKQFGIALEMMPRAHTLRRAWSRVAFKSA